MNDRMYYSREAEIRAQRERATAVFIFLILGLGIGTVLALLFAPKSGEKTRAELEKAMNQGLEGGRDAADKAMKNLEKDFNDLRKKVEDRMG